MKDRAMRRWCVWVVLVVVGAVAWADEPVDPPVAPTVASGRVTDVVGRPVARARVHLRSSTSSRSHARAHASRWIASSLYGGNTRQSFFGAGFTAGAARVAAATWEVTADTARAHANDRLSHKWAKITLGTAGAAVVAGAITLILWNPDQAETTFTVSPVEHGSGASATYQRTW